MIELFNTLFTYPLTNVLVALVKILDILHVPYSLGFSVIILTVLIKLVLYPLMSSQIKSSVKMQKLAPKLAQIKEKYKKDKQRQQVETMKLYQEQGINPAAGCLPLLIQFPILISLYHMLTSVVSANSIDAIEKVNNVLYFSFLRIENVWDASFFGIPLSLSPQKMFETTPLIILAPVLTGVFQFILSRMMIPMASEKDKDKPKKDDLQSAIQTQSLFIFPVMIAWFSFTLPFGLTLYWNTFTFFGILQQYLLVGPGRLTPWFEKIGLHGKGSERNH